MIFKLKVAVLVASAAVLSACGSSDNGPTINKVATSDLTVAASPATTTSVAKNPFSFPGGVPELGTGAATTLTFGAPATGTTAPTFSIAGFGQGTANGTTTFGSCIFTVTNSSFPAGHPLANGQVLRVDPCEFNINTKGEVADGHSEKRKIKLKLGNTQSDGQDNDVKIDRDGNVKVNDQDEGKTPTTDVTGGSS